MPIIPPAKGLLPIMNVVKIMDVSQKRLTPTIIKQLREKHSYHDRCPELSEHIYSHTALDTLKLTKQKDKSVLKQMRASIKFYDCGYFRVNKF